MTDAFTSFLLYLETDWFNIVWPIVAALFAIWIANVIAKFVTRSREAVKPITHRILTKDCPACLGKGSAGCSTCKSEGKLQSAVEKTGPCPQCNGSGSVRAACLQCNGTGTIQRPLRYNVTGASTESHWSLFPFGWHQTVSVVVRNLEQMAGKFVVRATIADPSHQSKELPLSLGPGATRQANLTFKLAGKGLFDPSYEIEPEVIPFTCITCQGEGTQTRPCAVCGGTGQVKETTRIEVVCNTCGGKGSTTCSVCKGVGRVGRFSAKSP